MTNSKRWAFWVFLGVAFFTFLYLIRGILLPFVVGGLAAYLLIPAADRLEQRGCSRGMSTIIITGLFFLALAFLFILLPPLLFDQFSGLISVLPEYVAAFRERYDAHIAQWLGMLPPEEITELKKAATDSSGEIAAMVANVVGGALKSGMLLTNVLALMLITPVVTFYLLRDWDRIVERMNRLLPRRHADIIREQLHKIDQALAGFIRGQINVCLILALFYAIALSMTGLKFAVAIGMLAGFLLIIPYVGALFAALVGMGVAFFQFDAYADMGMVLGVFLIGQVLEGNFLTPKLVGEKVGLHPVWIIFGMLAGGALFGFVGILLAVPATATIGVLIRFVTERYLESGYYSGEAG